MPLASNRTENDRRTRPLVSFALSILAVAALGLVALAPGASAAVPEQASFSMTLGTGKSGKLMKKSGVKFGAIKPSQQKRLSGKRVRITSDLKASRLDGEVLGLAGGIKFSKGKRKLAFRQVEVRVTTDPMQIWGTTRGKSIKLFTTKANADVDPAFRSVKYNPSALKLSKRSAKMIKSKLRLKKLPAAKAGTLSNGFYMGAIEDPYLDLCGLSATSISSSTVPVAADPPAFANALTAVGEPITWGFKASFNGYVNAIGSIQGLDGATVNRNPFAPPQVPPADFTFAFDSGEYAANDQAVLNGTGNVMYCNQAHGFRINIANPTVVIDGASSRIIADVNTNISGDLTPPQRVHLADLDLAGATIDDSVPGEVTWQDMPATLSQTGSEALRLCEVSVPGAPAGCLYPPGTPLDALTVTANFAVG